MGQAFAKIRELLTQIISISSCKRLKNETRTSKPTNLEEREQVITIPDAHIVTIPEENEDENRRKNGQVTEEFRFNLANGEAAGSSNWLRTQPKKRDKWIKHYCSSRKILLVGEGDFSFSSCLAIAFGSATNMVATSLDSQNFLRKQYRHAMSNINYLVNRGCFVIHDRIIYNFPWAGFFKDCPRETALNSLYHEVEQLRERLITIPDDTPYISSATTDETVETNEQISVPISDDAYTAVTIVEEHYDESKQIIHDLGGTSIDIAEGENIVFTVSEPAKENVYNCKECDQTTQDSAFSSDAVKWVPKDICAAQPKKKDKWIKHYCSSHKILLVGEGDFSFSACLAQAFGSATNMVATSLDSKDFLKKNYKRAMSNINYLKNKGCKVIHNMDATEMANNNPLIIGMKFNRIVYNFPLAGFFKGYSRKNQLKFNRNLVRLFMKNAKEMLEKDGEIHITHKSYGFYLEWDLEKLARRNGLGLIEDVEFELSDYPGYNNKYGFGGDDNFDCYGSQTYKFCIS